MKAIFIPLLAVLTLAACSKNTPTDDHTEAMAREHKGDAPIPGAAGDTTLDATKAATLEGTSVEYGDIAGTATHGHLTVPPDASNKPALIVIHEWWGLNDNVKVMAERFAAEGYTTLAVDLYAGKAGTTPAEAKALMMESMGRPDALKANLKQAHDFLKARGATSIGVVGWCFGGGWTLQSALMMGDDIGAAVIYYGRLITDEAALAPLDTPVLGHFGSEDKGIPMDSVRAFEAALDKLEKPATIHVYEGADHAFANPSGKHYNEPFALDAWARTLAFFKTHLK